MDIPQALMPPPLPPMIDKSKLPPAQGMAGTPPLPIPGGGLPLPPKAPDKGGLPVGIVAMIQGIYQREERRRMQLSGKPDTGLQQGWGGAGTTE